MKALQWSMTIPQNKQGAFLKWFNEIAGPQLNGFGAVKHEIYQVTDKPVIGHQTVEENRFIERVYFEDSFNISEYFARVKAAPAAWALSRMYEKDFGATNIELRIIEEK